MPENSNPQSSESGTTVCSAPQFQYVVMLSHLSDDVPCLLTECQDSAFQFASEVGWEFTGTPLAGVLDLPDASTPCCVSVITFRDGIPCSRVVVRSFDDDRRDDDDFSTEPETDPVLQVS